MPASPSLYMPNMSAAEPTISDMDFMRRFAFDFFCPRPPQTMAPAAVPAMKPMPMAVIIVDFFIISPAFHGIIIDRRGQNLQGSC